MTMPAHQVVYDVLAEALRPREAITVSAWADLHRQLSSKGSAEPGQWHTSRNPPLREIMDALSTQSETQDVVVKFPIQMGKTECAVNWLGYIMDHAPGPVMVALPAEVSMIKWSNQKLEPTLEITVPMREALTSVASRETANQKFFKDFKGGQLYLEHAGSPARLKSTSVCYLIVDELDEFSSELKSGDDPEKLLDGRVSAFPATYKKLRISTPTIKGTSRIDAAYEASDQRMYHIACPECRHEQPFEWSGLCWNEDATQCWYACRSCGAVIHEHQKTQLIRAGRWIPKYPGRTVRGYTINGLYYPVGLGPTWLKLVHEFREAANDPPKLKTFLNDRLAESWEDPATRAVRQDMLADRAESYALRTAPSGVLVVTAGVDTQDNRLAVHIVGWGHGMASWTLDYVELDGDPANDAVWVSLTELINRPILHASGALLRVAATFIDAGGHRGEAVKAYARKRLIPRVAPIYGATAVNAPVINRGKFHDVTWQGVTDKRSVVIYQVGTNQAKHWVYGRMGADAEKDVEKRLVHFSEHLPDMFFAGMTSETWDPRKNRFFNRRGARNEPLDTYVYAYAAAHHPELRLHRYTIADWNQREASLLARAPKDSDIATGTNTQPLPARPAVQQRKRKSGGLAGDDWSIQ